MEKKDDFVWGVLLHLGTNMWHDWNRDLVGIPSSLEEERKMYPDRKVGKHGILPELENTLDSWASHGNLAASILELDKAGFDIMPCTSNWSSTKASDAMVRFCRDRVNPAHLKGILTAPWAGAFVEDAPKVHEGIRLFAEAKRKYY